MKFLNRFKKKTKQDSMMQIHADKVCTLAKLGLSEKQLLVDVFSKNILVTFPEKLKNSVDQLIADLNNTISQHLNELCKESIENAIEFIEWTGEALHIMLDPEDEPEYIEAFMKNWNDGEIDELVSFYNRWYSVEDATKIARACKEVSNGKVITIYELLQLGAEAILKLSLHEYNFGNIYWAIKEQLEQDSKEILKFMYPMSIDIKQAPNGTLLFIVNFQNDWEVEHGIDWIIKDKTPVYVGQNGVYFSESDEILTWDRIHGCSR